MELAQSQTAGRGGTWIAVRLVCSPPVLSAKHSEDLFSCPEALPPQKMAGMTAGEKPKAWRQARPPSGRAQMLELRPSFIHSPSWGMGNTEGMTGHWCGWLEWSHPWNLGEGVAPWVPTACLLLSLVKRSQGLGSAGLSSAQKFHH